MVALVSSSVKLLTSGLKLAIWDGWTNWPTRDRLAWLAKLFELGKDVVISLGDVLKPMLPAGSRPETAAHLWAVHVACFGEALAHYWGGSQRMAGRGGKWGKWFDPAWVQLRRSEVEAAFRFSLVELARSPGPTLPRENWLDAPTASPMYRALWKAFAGHEVTLGSSALLPLDQDGDVQAFERAFTQSFREAMVRGGNVELRTLLSDATPRGEALRELLLADMASWRHQHVFVGVDTTEGIPEMPLETTYVEPTALVELDHGKRRGPVISILEDLLADHQIIFVSADFGHGKSLTARTLAWRWARDYLAPVDTATSDRTYPIHVRCHGDASTTWNLENVIRRGLKRRAEEAGISVKLQDGALSPPPAEQRAVYLLDGLDELILTENQTRDLVRELQDQATSRQRFIVFSRPEALPKFDSSRGQSVIPHVHIQSFSPDQVDDWLWAWPRAAPSRQQLKEHELTELAGVPILLFMIALTWPTYSSPNGPIPRVQIYETFFQTLAAGKYERGGDTHPQIRAAAELARDSLVDRKKLPPWRGAQEGRERAVEAMRWLMDRVAWEAKRREFAGEILSRRHVDNLLEDELGLPDNTLEQVRIGLLLGMQAHISSGSSQIFFGHRSFMEYAIACFWGRQLRESCTADPRDFEVLEEQLSGAPISEPDSRIFPFLSEILDRWETNDCKRLLAWAKATVSDETTRPPRDQRRVTFRNDTRTLIRQSALAIGCKMAGRLQELFDIGDGTVLLTISSWWLIVKKKSATIEAPRCRVANGALLSGLVGAGANFSRAQLSFINLESANLRSSNLSAADLSGAHLERIDLCQATLRGVNLAKAELFGASLDGADLRQGNLDGANASNASIEGANLEGASLDRTNLFRVNLANTNLTDANLHLVQLSGARLNNANLQRAVLDGSNLQGANFSHANLEKARLVGVSLSSARLFNTNLTDADLEGSNLSNADLSGADLSGANLTGTKLETVNLHAARYDRTTRWPEGFAPNVESNGYAR